MRRATLAYDGLVALARRHARIAADAEDIVQEVLISAIAAGRDDLSLSANRRWMAGAIRKRAAFDARSAARRRAREVRWQAERNEGAVGAEGEALEAILSGLSKSLRVVAALALSGHTRTEIAYLLGLPDTALRQRIRALKTTLARKGVQVPEGLPGLKLDLAYGRLREALVEALRRRRGILATHDPDGHVIVISRSQN